jgi:hypothetical protein
MPDFNQLHNLIQYHNHRYFHVFTVMLIGQAVVLTVYLRL